MTEGGSACIAAALRFSRQVSFALALGWLTWSTLGRAAPARLDELRLPGAESCPPPSALRDAILVHLGYDPFSEPAERVVVVRLQPEEGGLVAHLTLSDENGVLLGERVVASSSGDCRELSDALALAISIALDPVSAGRPIVQRPSTLPATELEPVASTPTSDPLQLLVGVGVLGAAGAAAIPNLGFELAAEVRWKHLALALGGRADLPAGVAVGTGSVSTSLLVAEVMPCWHAGWFGGCVVGQVGAQSASANNLYQARQTTGPYAAVGARGLFELPLTGSFGLRLGLELLAPLIKTNVYASTTGGSAFTTPPLSGDLTLGAVFRLL